MWPRESRAHVVHFAGRAVRLVAVCPEEWRLCEDLLDEAVWAEDLRDEPPRPPLGNATRDKESPRMTRRMPRIAQL
jgi:hypothetical protein